MSTSTKTLKITFRQAEEHRTAAQKRLKRAEAGATGKQIKQDAQFILNFQEFSEVERLMRRSSLVLLEAIVHEQPESIRDTAKIVGRDYREVHRNLAELEELGVIEFEEDSGRKRPHLRGESEIIDFSFTIPQDSIGDVHPASV
jgi:predicted transcriptional regulator